MIGQVYRSKMGSFAGSEWLVLGQDNVHSATCRARTDMGILTHDRFDREGVKQMKQSEIMVGGVYETLVSGVLVRVEVVGRCSVPKRPGGPCLTRYTVKRSDNGKPLGKARSAAALRPARTAEEMQRREAAIREAERRLDRLREG